MRETEHVARMENKRAAYKVWRWNLKEREYLGDEDVDVRIILKWVFIKYNWKAPTGLIWLRIWKSGGLLWKQ